MTEKFVPMIEETQTILEWSEFHYHLFSHLISDECPCDLAQNVELGCFPTSWVPNTDFMSECVKACARSEGPEELNQMLQELVDLAKKAYPTYHWDHKMTLGEARDYLKGKL